MNFLNLAEHVTIEPVMEEISHEQAARRKRLRAELDGVRLAPEITQDEFPDPQDVATKTRDTEFEANRPPHHESK